MANSGVHVQLDAGANGTASLHSAWVCRWNNFSFCDSEDYRCCMHTGGDLLKESTRGCMQATPGLLRKSGRWRAVCGSDSHDGRAARLRLQGHHACWAACCPGWKLQKVHSPAVSLQCPVRKLNITLTLKEKYIREFCCLLQSIY